ncbi:hypothetical protein FS749_011178 [Ceratobasidium sp. UAMH 11750]|nr:hypothetical protein FS749_011178 [Ceratobasidium sp. UAMH 11750]
MNRQLQDASKPFDKFDSRGIVDDGLNREMEDLKCCRPSSAHAHARARWLVLCAGPALSLTTRLPACFHPGVVLSLGRPPSCSHPRHCALSLLLSRPSSRDPARSA